MIWLNDGFRVHESGFQVRDTIQTFTADKQSIFQLTVFDPQLPHEWIRNQNRAQVAVIARSEVGRLVVIIELIGLEGRYQRVLDPIPKQSWLGILQYEK